MEQTEHMIAASKHLGRAMEGRNNGDELSDEIVTEAYNWALESGYITSYAGMVPDLESKLNSDDQAAREYCYNFDVNLLDYSQDIEDELGSEFESGPDM